MVSHTLQPQRPDVLGRAGLDRSSPLDGRPGMGRDRGCPCGLASGHRLPFRGSPPFGKPLLADHLWEIHVHAGDVGLAVLVTMVCGVALMFGSVGTWVQVQGTSATSQLNGLDQQVSVLIGVNGYVTFIGGIVLVILGGLALSSEETLLVVLTILVSLAVLVFSIFDVFRVVQKICSCPHRSIRT